jgi:hypothetical protein
LYGKLLLQAEAEVLEIAAQMVMTAAEEAEEPVVYIQDLPPLLLNFYLPTLILILLLAQAEQAAHQLLVSATV